MQFSFFVNGRNQNSFQKSKSLPQNKESHTGLEQHNFYFWVDYPFKDTQMHKMFICSNVSDLWSSICDALSFDFFSRNSASLTSLSFLSFSSHCLSSAALLFSSWRRFSSSFCKRDKSIKQNKDRLNQSWQLKSVDMVMYMTMLMYLALVH